MRVREIGTYKRMAASGTICAAGGGLIGVTCTTAGTLQITEGEASGGADIFSSITMTAGSFYPLACDCPLGAYGVLGGGAVVTFIK